MTSPLNATQGGAAAVALATLLAQSQQAQPSVSTDTVATLAAAALVAPAGSTCTSPRTPEATDVTHPANLAAGAIAAPAGSPVTTAPHTAIAGPSTAAPAAFAAAPQAPTLPLAPTPPLPPPRPQASLRPLAPPLPPGPRPAPKAPTSPPEALPPQPTVPPRPPAPPASRPAFSFALPGGTPCPLAARGTHAPFAFNFAQAQPDSGVTGAALPMPEALGAPVGQTQTFVFSAGPQDGPSDTQAPFFALGTGSSHGGRPARRAVSSPLLEQAGPPRQPEGTRLLEPADQETGSSSSSGSSSTSSIASEPDEEAHQGPKKGSENSRSPVGGFGQSLQSAHTQPRRTSSKQLEAVDQKDKPTTPKTKFDKMYDTIFSFEKGCDKGCILLKVAAWIVTIVTGLFIPLGIWWACSKSSCLSKEKVTKPAQLAASGATTKKVLLS